MMRRLTEHKLFWVIFVTAALCVLLMTVCMGRTYDTAFHMMRLDALAQYFQDGGVYPCRLYREICDGYGYAAPMYYCDMLFVPFAGLHAFGVPKAFCFKALRAVCLILPFVTMFWMLLRERFQKQDALWGALLYAFVPIVMGKIGWSDQMGAAGANIFLPLVFLPLWGLSRRDARSVRYQVGSALCLALGLSGVLGTHIISLALTFLFAVIIVLVNARTVLFSKRIFVLIAAGVLSLLCMAWFWMPFLEQLVSCNLSVNARGTACADLSQYALDPLIYFGNFFSYLVANELFATPKLLPSRDFGAGWYITPVLVFAFCDFLRRLRDRRSRCADRGVLNSSAGVGPTENTCVQHSPFLRLLSLISYLFSFLSKYIFAFLSLSLLVLFFSPFLLRLLSHVLGWIQFGTRFYAFFALFFAVWTVQLIQSWRHHAPSLLTSRLRWIVFGLFVSLMLFLSDIFGIRIYGQFMVDVPGFQDDLWSVKTVPNRIGMGEYLPYRSEISKIKVPDIDGDVYQPRYVLADGQPVPFKDTPSGVTAEIPSGKTELEIPLFYYKGYSASLDGHILPVTESDRGLLQLHANGQGGHLIVSYEGTSIQRLSAWISGVTLATLVMGSCFWTFISLKRRRKSHV